MRAWIIWSCSKGICIKTKGGKSNLLQEDHILWIWEHVIHSSVLQGKVVYFSFLVRGDDDDAWVIMIVMVNACLMSTKVFSCLRSVYLRRIFRLYWYKEHLQYIISTTTFSYDLVGNSRLTSWFINVFFTPPSGVWIISLHAARRRAVVQEILETDWVQCAGNICSANQQGPADLSRAHLKFGPAEVFQSNTEYGDDELL